MKSENKTLWEFLNELLQDTAQQEELEKLLEVEEVYQFLAKKGYKKDFNKFKIELGEIMKKYLKLQNISEKDLESVAGGTKTGKRITSMALTALMLANSGAGAINIEMKQKSTAQAKKFISDVLNKGKNFVQSGKKFIQSDKNKPLVTAVGASLAAVAGTATLVATTGGLYAAYKNFIDVFELAENGDNNDNLQKATSLLRILELAANIKFKSGSTTDLDAEYAKEFARALTESPFWDTHRSVTFQANSGIYNRLKNYYGVLTNGASLSKSEQVYKLTLRAIYYSGILNMEVKPKFGEKKHIIKEHFVRGMENGIIMNTETNSGVNAEFPKEYNRIVKTVHTLLNKSIDDLRSTEKAITQSKKSLESAEKSLEKLAKVKDKSSANKNYNDKLEEILKELNKRKAVLVGLSASKEAIEKIDEAIDNVKKAINKPEGLYVAKVLDENYSKETEAINAAKAAIIAAKQKLNEKATEEPPPEPIVNETEKKLEDLKSIIIEVRNHISYIQFDLSYLDKFLPKSMDIDKPWATARNSLFNKVTGGFTNDENKQFGFNEAKEAFKIIHELLYNSEDAKKVIERFSNNLNTCLYDASYEVVKLEINELKENLNENDLDDALTVFKFLENELENVKENVEDFSSKIEDVEGTQISKNSDAKISKSTLQSLKSELEKLKTKVEAEQVLLDKTTNDETIIGLKTAINVLGKIIQGAGANAECDVKVAQAKFIFSAMKTIGNGDSADKLNKVIEIFENDSYDPFKRNLKLACGALEFAEKVAKEANINFSYNKYKDNLKTKLNAIKAQAEKIRAQLQTLLAQEQNQAFKNRLQAEFKDFDGAIQKLQTVINYDNSKLLEKETIKNLFDGISLLFKQYEESQKINYIEIGDIKPKVASFANNGTSDIKDVAETLVQVGRFLDELEYIRNIDIVNEMKERITEMASSLNTLLSKFTGTSIKSLLKETCDNGTRIQNALQKLNEIKTIKGENVKEIAGKLKEAFEFIKDEINVFYDYSELKNVIDKLENNINEDNLEEAILKLDDIKNMTEDVQNKFTTVLDKMTKKPIFISKVTANDGKNVKQKLESIRDLLELKNYLLSSEEKLKETTGIDQKLDKLQSAISLLENSTVSPDKLASDLLVIFGKDDISMINDESETFNSIMNFINQYASFVKKGSKLFNKKFVWNAIFDAADKFDKELEQECKEKVEKFVDDIGKKLEDFKNAVKDDPNLKAEYGEEIDQGSKLYKIATYLNGFTSENIVSSDITKLSSEPMKRKFTNILNIFKTVKEDIEATKYEHEVDADELEANLTSLSSGEKPEKARETFEQVSKVLDTLKETKNIKPKKKIFILITRESKKLRNILEKMDCLYKSGKHEFRLNAWNQAIGKFEEICSSDADITTMFDEIFSAICGESLLMHELSISGLEVFDLLDEIEKEKKEGAISLEKFEKLLKYFYNARCAWESIYEGIKEEMKDESTIVGKEQWGNLNDELRNLKDRLDKEGKPTEKLDEAISKLSDFTSEKIELKDIIKPILEAINSDLAIPSDNYEKISYLFNLTVLENSENEQFEFINDETQNFLFKSIKETVEIWEKQ